MFHAPHWGLREEVHSTTKEIFGDSIDSSITDITVHCSDADILH